MIQTIKSISLASRPKTLATSIAPVIVGSAFAISDNNYDLKIFMYTLFAAILIQVGTNFANDLYDYIKGADNDERVGPLRTVQAKLISVRSMKYLMIGAFSMAILCGIPLVIRGGYPILIIGLVSIASGYAYTAGPYPLGYNGWGDLFVFCFFGPIAVCGTYFLQTLSFSMEPMIAGLILGCLSVTLLCVNNIRDAETDKKVGKRTLAVRISPQFVKIMFISLFLLSYFFSIYLSSSLNTKLFLILITLTIPLFFNLSRDILNLKSDKLNHLLGKVSSYIIIYSLIITFCILL